MTPKISLEDDPHNPSSIIVPPDDKYSVFWFIAWISGVACSYEWNAENFLKTFIMEILILCLLQILNCFKKGHYNYNTKLDIIEEKMIGPTALYATLFMIAFCL